MNVFKSYSFRWDIYVYIYGCAAGIIFASCYDGIIESPYITIQRLACLDKLVKTGFT